MAKDFAPDSWDTPAPEPAKAPTPATPAQRTPRQPREPVQRKERSWRQNGAAPEPQRQRKTYAEPLRQKPDYKDQVRVFLSDENNVPLKFTRNACYIATKATAIRWPVDILPRTGEEILVGNLVWVVQKLRWITSGAGPQAVQVVVKMVNSKGPSTNLT